MKIALCLNGDRGLTVESALVKMVTVTDVDLIWPNDFDDIKLSWWREFDALVVAGFPKIIPPEVINAVPTAINCHAGPLPEYRGGSPLNWQIINGCAKIGISICNLTKELDGGDVLWDVCFPLNDEDDIATVHEQANKLFAHGVLQLLCGPTDHLRPPRKQESRQARYHVQRMPQDGRINWNQDCAKVCDFVRAITRPYPGAFAIYETNIVRIWRTSIAEINLQGPPGRVWKNKGDIHVCTDGGAVVLEDFEGPELKTGDYLNDKPK